MNVLIACEESQRVCVAFREKGHNAYSCDIQDCSGGHPEWHVKGDALLMLTTPTFFTTCDGTKHIIPSWDLIIAHPPCTYLSNAGNRWLYKGGVVNNERYKKGCDARDFFLKFYNADCPRICIENPMPNKLFGLPHYTQVIQPYEYGHRYTKRTCLWLKGLAELEPTLVVPKEERITTAYAAWYNRGGGERQKNRSKTFPGIARAMAEQWG